MVPKTTRGGQMSPRNPRIGREAFSAPQLQPATDTDVPGQYRAGRLRRQAAGVRAGTERPLSPPAAGCRGVERSVARRQAAALTPEGARCFPEIYEALNPAMTEKNAPRNCLPG